MCFLLWGWSRLGDVLKLRHATREEGGEYLVYGVRKTVGRGG